MLLHKYPSFSKQLDGEQIVRNNFEDDDIILSTPRYDIKRLGHGVESQYGPTDAIGGLSSGKYNSDDAESDNMSMDELSPRKPSGAARLPDDESDQQVPHISQPVHHSIGDLRSILEIPEKYRQVFSAYPCFNIIQSKALDVVLYTDEPVVVSAPTGSGKTVLFELAIVRLVIEVERSNYTRDYKIVYMAPVKALCTERYNDWMEKFSYLGLKCMEITGDSELSDYFALQNYQIILTTPEKWDSLTRKWRDNKSLVQVVKLFLIDEVHLLNDEKRGPTMEAVVSRMKTVQRTLKQDLKAIADHNPSSSAGGTGVQLRFMAVSATIPNVEDVAEWLGGRDVPATFYKISDDLRPVKLQKFVYGYHCPEGWTPFRFDISLSYKLRDILFNHAGGKPTLIFCSTRKGVQQTGSTLIKEITFHFQPEQHERIMLAANMIRDHKIREFLLAGVGCHHAGMHSDDRHNVEELFRAGYLPVVIATTTLAMGVNLPAHLVVIKATQQYIAGEYREYSESQLLQMIGRAGRPQFDTSAVAVIMTKTALKEKYMRLVDGRDVVESSLHRHLVEHLNAEIVLHTITDVAVAMDWIRSTFLYVRAIKNPKHYGMPADLSKDRIENKLQELCLRDLNALARSGLIRMDEMDIWPTEIGRLMARYYVAFETMKMFTELEGDVTLQSLLRVISHCQEFAEIQLRMNERKTLNILNKDKHRECIRFPFPGKIKSREMKINCLIQAVFGCLPLQDPSLLQETLKIMRIGQRTSKCLQEYVSRRPEYKANLSAVLLAKCFHCKLWENSIYVARQLERIGPALAGLLAAAGKTTFRRIREANPRDLERILNRAPPLGNHLQEAAAYLPRYDLQMESEFKRPGQSDVTIKVTLVNAEELSQQSTAGTQHTCILLVGDTSNRLLHKERFSDLTLIRVTQIIKTISVDSYSAGHEVFAHLISEFWAGLDVEASVKLYGGEHVGGKFKQAVDAYIEATGGAMLPKVDTSSQNKDTAKNIKQCQKQTTETKCDSVSSHDPATSAPRKKMPIIEHIRQKAEVYSKLPLKRLKMDEQPSPVIDLNKFKYTPQKNKLIPWNTKKPNPVSSMSAKSANLECLPDIRKLIENMSSMNKKKQSKTTAAEEQALPVRRIKERKPMICEPEDGQVSETMKVFESGSCALDMSSKSDYMEPEKAAIPCENTTILVNAVCFDERNKYNDPELDEADATKECTSDENINEESCKDDRISSTNLNSNLSMNIVSLTPKLCQNIQPTLKEFVQRKQGIALKSRTSENRFPVPDFELLDDVQLNALLTPPKEDEPKPKKTAGAHSALDSSILMSNGSLVGQQMVRPLLSQLTQGSSKAKSFSTICTQTDAKFTLKESSRTSMLECEQIGTCRDKNRQETHPGIHVDLSKEKCETASAQSSDLIFKEPWIPQRSIPHERHNSTYESSTQQHVPCSQSSIRSKHFISEEEFPPNGSSSSYVGEFEHINLEESHKQCTQCNRSGITSVVSHLPPHLQSQSVTWKVPVTGLHGSHEDYDVTSRYSRPHGDLYLEKGFKKMTHDCEVCIPVTHVQDPKEFIRPRNRNTKDLPLSGFQGSYSTVESSHPALQKQNTISTKPVQKPDWPDLIASTTLKAPIELFDPPSQPDNSSNQNFNFTPLKEEKQELSPHSFLSIYESTALCQEQRSGRLSPTPGDIYPDYASQTELTEGIRVLKKRPHFPTSNLQDFNSPYQDQTTYKSKLERYYS